MAAVRSDILEQLAVSTHRQQALDFAQRMMEAVQDRLDPVMRGWMPTGQDSSESFGGVTTDLPSLRAASRKAFYQHAHGRGVIRTLVKFVIGGGIVVDFHERDEEALLALNDLWYAFQREIRWFSFAREFVTRGFRDGEVFVRRFPRPDAPLTLRFIDPEKILEIKNDPNDAETAESYSVAFGVKQNDIDASEILHVPLNVDRNVQRGRPILESILPYLTKYDKWLDARMVLNIIRASVALVQEVQGSSTDLLRLRTAQRASNSLSETDQSRMLRPGTILRGTPGVKYSMLSPNLDARDAAADGRTILMAVAAAAGFPDIFVTADYCHSMDTEALTERGWLHYRDLQPEDRLATMHPETGDLEFQTPQLHSFFYVGSMYRYWAWRAAFCVTPQHELFVSYLPVSESEEHPGFYRHYEKVRVSDIAFEAGTYLMTPASVRWQERTIAIADLATTNTPQLSEINGREKPQHELLHLDRIERIPWNDEVWCATVPNGLLVTRYEGKVLISGNSQANFSSTITAQNPAIREFEDWQHIFGEAFATIVDWVLADGMERQVLPMRTSEGRPINLGLDVAFPPLLKRDLAQEVTAYAQLMELRAMSRRTVQLKMGLDPDQEQHLIDQEGPPPTPTVKPAAKRPGDRNPRQQSTGEESKKMSVRVRRAKEESHNGADHDFEVDIAVPLAPAEVEVGGDGLT